jgi:hypothetical protein
MKKVLYSILLLCCVVSLVNAQSNFLDNYIGATVTPIVIASGANQVNLPQDLDFKPNTNELWIANYGNTNGGSNVIIYNAGLPNQSSQYRKDTHTAHFMRFPSAIAFGDDGKWACVSEIQSTGGPTSTFMGPALWTSDTAIHARVFQNNWLNGFPLGSHYDMLHQSPFAMGIAHDSAMAYWVNDGHNGNICLYDYVQHHGPGYDNHSAGKIWRYTDVTVTRVPNVPSHMILDKVNNWLYFIDGGPKKIKRMNVNSGVITGNLTTPASGQEPLASYKKVEGAIVEELDTLITQPCGIDYYNDRLVVSDHTTGDIYIYNTSGTFTLMGTIVTGLPGIMGVKVGPDGHIWCVNKTGNAVYRLDIISPASDIALIEITSPVVQNFKPDFYSTAFNVCDGTISPVVTILNKGTNPITSIDFEYTIDNLNPVIFTWTGTVAQGITASVTLPSASITNGSHLLKVTAININGSPDEIDLNNTIEGSFRAIDPPVSYPYTQDFAATLFPPSGWNYVNYNPNNKMSRVTAGGFGLSTGSMKMDNYSGAVDITGQIDYLMSPLIDMTSATSNAWLRFNVAYAKYNSASNDGLQVLVSTDCGITWSTIYNKSGTLLSTAPISTSAWTPSANQWRTDSVNISAFSGQSEVLLSFTATSNFGNNLYVDDIFVGDILTGMNELITENTISLFPNPATSTLNLSFAAKINQSTTGTIYSQDGRVVKTFLITPDQFFLQIDITDLSGGMYALSLTGENTSFTKVFVKQ